jgi:hypothetical protein
MLLGAGIVFGRAWEALMRALRGSESFDIVVEYDTETAEMEERNWR